MILQGLEKKHYTYGAAIAAVFLLALLFFRYVWHRHPAPVPPPIPAIKLHYTTVPVDKTYIGITQSIASVGIRARVRGFLTEMRFIEGKPVKDKQLLFVIDPKPFQVKVDAAEGRLAKSIAEEAFFKVQYARMKILVAKGDISKARHDEVKAQYEGAVGQVQVDRASLEDEKINLGYCYMNAPFNGFIGEKRVDVGNLVGGTDSTLLATVNQLDPMYIQFSPSVADFSEMLAYEKNKPFPVVAVLPENPQLEAKGSVQLVDNLANTDTSSILMRATIRNPNSLLLPGLYVETHIHLGDNPKAICVPKAAIMEDQGQKAVYVVDDKGVVKAVEIEVNGEFNHQAIVTKGLDVGQVVLTSATQKLEPGMVVSPQLG